MLNNETTLLDKIYSIGSCNLITEKLDNNFFYVKGSPISENPWFEFCPWISSKYSRFWWKRNKFNSYFQKQHQVFVTITHFTDLVVI